MIDRTPRLRMFAGPNGSGKSTLKQYIQKYLPPDSFGVYINSDEILDRISATGFLDLAEFGVESEKILPSIIDSPLIRAKDLSAEARKLTLTNNRLFFNLVPVNGYYASAIGDFIRWKLLQKGASFSFETVMSHPSKIEILAQARRLGFRTYLYYVATDDPDINIARVRYRVSRGGHDVPTDKIKERYFRSLDLLLPAIRNTNRAYVWDNSGQGAPRSFLAEITEGAELELKSDLIPAWFQHAVLGKITLP